MFSAIFGFAFACVLVYLGGKLARRIPRWGRELLTLIGCLFGLMGSVFVLLIVFDDHGANMLLRVLWGTAFMLAAAIFALKSAPPFIMAFEKQPPAEPEYQNRPY